MNITPIPSIDSKLGDFNLTQKIKVGEILDGIIEEVWENKTYLFKLKGFTFKARSPLPLKKYERVQVEVKGLEPRVVFKLLPQEVKENLAISQQKDKTKPRDTNCLYFTTSNLSSLGINNLTIKRYETDEELSPKGTKSEYEALDILLEMSKLGKVLVKITRLGNLSYYQISVEDKIMKEFIEENLPSLITDLKNVGYSISNINCSINARLKNKYTSLESTLSRTEKGYCRVDVKA